MAAGLQIFCLFALFAVVLSDTYMHMPRGSNNRLNEQSANRNNANRLFNSQVSVRNLLRFTHVGVQGVYV